MFVVKRYVVQKCMPLYSSGLRPNLLLNYGPPYK